MRHDWTQEMWDAYFAAAQDHDRSAAAYFRSRPSSPDVAMAYDDGWIDRQKPAMRRNEEARRAALMQLADFRTTRPDRPRRRRWLFWLRG